MTNDVAIIQRLRRPDGSTWTEYQVAVRNQYGERRERVTLPDTETKDALRATFATIVARLEPQLPAEPAPINVDITEAKREALRKATIGLDAEVAKARAAIAAAKAEEERVRIEAEADRVRIEVDTVPVRERIL